MEKNPSLIERKIIMIPILIPTDFEKIEIDIPTKHELIYGKLVPIDFERIPKCIPIYKKIMSPLLI